jgi:RNA polymerase sigma-70 factor (ECF subfamily)
MSMVGDALMMQSSTTQATVTRVPITPLDAESVEWLASLKADGIVRDDAIARLHALLLKAARFEINRRRSAIAHLRGDDFDDLAHQSADGALVAVLAKLHTFQGRSRFTTWAYKFALLEAAVTLRRRAWQGREVPLPAENWERLIAPGKTPDGDRETAELVELLGDTIKTELTPHQRDVLVSTTLNGVPIDVLAERLNTTRGALYKALHDARQKLRRRLAARGFAIEGERL